MTPVVLSDPERRAWWQLSRTAGIGPITFFKLLERYGTALAALQALPDMARRGGRAAPFNPFPHTAAEDELAAAVKIGARMIAACEPDYPALLRQIDDAPPMIVVRAAGPLPWVRPCVGMVGARNASLPGRKMASMLARDLGAAGYTVASGLARGIDTAAHEGSLSTGTVAVVAGGVDVVYPPENQKLYDQIVAMGAVISEHPVGTEPKAPYFPRRNRIISGLSKGVVVVEATTNSGSLITAHAALEQGRDVFAVPGSPLDPRAGGPNGLIRDGAVLVEEARHIMDHLQTQKSFRLSETPPAPYTSPPPVMDDQTLRAAQEQILDNLTYTAINIDELARVCDHSVVLVQTVLLDLELAGRVQRLPGNRILLIQKENARASVVSGHC